MSTLRLLGQRPHLRNCGHWKLKAIDNCPRLKPRDGHFRETALVVSTPSALIKDTTWASPTQLRPVISEILFHAIEKYPRNHSVGTIRAEALRKIQTRYCEPHAWIRHGNHSLSKRFHTGQAMILTHDTTSYPRQVPNRETTEDSKIPSDSGVNPFQLRHQLPPELFLRHVSFGTAHELRGTVEEFKSASLLSLSSNKDHIHSNMAIIQILPVRLLGTLGGMHQRAPALLGRASQHSSHDLEIDLVEPVSVAHDLGGDEAGVDDRGDDLAGLDRLGEVVGKLPHEQQLDELGDVVSLSLLSAEVSSL